MEIKARLEREFALLATVNRRRESGYDVGTIEDQVVARHLIELEMQEADAVIEHIKQQVDGG